MIEADGLTKRFRQLRGYRDLLLYPLRERTHLAVDNVTIAIEPGEVFGLLGENGAGKTTLIRMLSTTLIPSAGRARVAGHDVVSEPHAVRRAVGLVSGDERTFYWRLTGRQNLEFFAALYHVPGREAENRIDELLERLGVADVASQRFNTYSSGTKQKFALARGLLTQPRVLFLDEPTRALDPIAADEVRSHISRHVVRELGTTVLIATHTLAEAEAICDRIAIMRHGHIYASGSVDALRREMGLSDAYELELVGSEASMREAISRVDGVRNLEFVQASGHLRLTLELQSADGTMNDLLMAVLSTGAAVRSSNIRRPTLDDVYRVAHAAS